MDSEIYNWFRNTHHIAVPKDWLEACLNWLQNDQQVARNELGTLVYNQWLVADLREIGAKCLVQNLSNVKSTILKGYFPLQIDSIQDISKPSYQQLLKLEGKNHGNADVSADNDWKAEKFQDKNRMLKLKLTDGDQDIVGLEYQSIPSLHINLPPGSKVLIYGEILSRNGTLLLKKDNVKILGGEVSELTDANSSLTLIREKLDACKLLNAAPSDLPVALDDVITNGHAGNSIGDGNRPRKQMKFNHTQSLSDKVQFGNSGSHQATTISNSDDIWSDEDMFDLIQPPSLPSISNSQSPVTDFRTNLVDDNLTPKNSTYNTSHSNLTSAKNYNYSKTGTNVCHDDFSLDSDEEFEILLNSAKKFRQTSQKPTAAVPPQIKTPLQNEIPKKNVNVPHTSVLFSDDDSDEEFETLILSSKREKIVPLTPPFIYIDTLPLLPTAFYFKAVIKGFVITFLSPLRTSNQSLSMEVLINDGTGSIKSTFSVEVIINLLGMTLKEFQTLKKSSKLNLEAQQNMAKVLAQFQRKVINLSCLFEIEAVPQNTSVTIINLTEVSKNVVDYFEQLQT